ncbi:hypothetical protein FACS1894154_08340 [Betaproteobacteria bacterium]|nr:hypothetical protein FACS1894154_08340 [Betaproteobacteria bacterium]
MARDPKYDILFEPVKIGPKVSPNRFFQTSHCAGVGSERPGTQAMFRGTKAEGGWGVVFTEFCSIHPESDEFPYTSARLWDEGDVRNLRPMCDEIHKYDCLSGVQLWYGGMHSPGLESREVPRSASALPSNLLPARTMYSAEADEDDIKAIIQMYVLEDIKQVEYSYQDLLKMALVLGRLAGRITRPDERVGLLLPNLAPTLGLFLGLVSQRRVPAMLNYTAGVDGMQAACTAAQIRTLITSRAFVEQARLGDKLAALQGLERIVYLEDLRASMRFTDKLWLMGWALWFPRSVEVSASTEDAAVVLFTSGSEGKPKGVVLSHRAILSNIGQMRAVIDFTQEDRVLNVLPIFHCFGLTAGTLLPVLTGASLFLYPSPLHYRVIPELAYERGCTVLFGTATFLGNYARFAHPYDFYRLRYVVAGAEKLSIPVRDQWFEKFGIRILEGYGATETSPVIAVNTPMAFRGGTVGQLLPALEYHLAPVPGIERGGVLHVRGPNVMSGYLKADQPGVLQPPASDVGPGWYETGDIVDIDDDGFLHIVGRVKRFAKVAGEMVSLEAVEKLAYAAAPGATHAASTQPDAAKGEALVLFTTAAELQRAALQKTAQQLGVAELAVPRKIVVVSALPILGTGKTDYVTLKKMAEEA